MLGGVVMLMVAVGEKLDIISSVGLYVMGDSSREKSLTLSEYMPLMSA